MAKNIFILFIAIILAILTTTQTIASVAKNKRPDLASSMPFFSNGFAVENQIAFYFRETLADKQTGLPTSIPSGIREQAVAAFYMEPTASEALTIYGLSLENADRLAFMKSAYKLSRRENILTAWLLNNSAKENNIAAILDYYDVLIRTKSANADLLIPQLLESLTSDRMIDILYSKLSQNPPWARQFWSAASTNQTTAKNAARLRQLLYDVREEQSQYSDDRLISTLISNYMFEEAMALRSTLTSDRNNSLLIDKTEVLENSDFSSQPLFPPLDWQLFSTGEYGASISNGGLYLSAIQNSGGQFARQLVDLPPKPLNISISLNQANESTTLSIKLKCAENRQEDLSIVYIDLDQNNIQRSIDNSQGLCRYYWLDVFGRNLDDDNGLDVTITKISIR